VSAGTEPGGALRLETTTDGDIDGLFDGSRSMGAVARVILDPLAVGIDVGDQVTQKAVPFGGSGWR
jgi:hypothetical protein